MFSRTSAASTKSNGEGETSPVAVNTEASVLSQPGKPPKQAHPDTNSVVDAVEMLQQRKLKPDKERISTYIEKHWPAAFQNDASIVETLINEALSQALIVSVNNLDVISFRTPSKIGRMLRVTKILPYEGEVPSVVVHEAMRAIGAIETAASDFIEESPKGAGVTAEQLAVQLHGKLRLLNYNAKTLTEKVLPIACKQGFARWLSKQCFTLTESYRRENSIQLLPPISVDVDIQDVKVEVPRKAKPARTSKSKRDSNSSNKSIDKSSDSESSSAGRISRRRPNDTMLDIDDIEELGNDMDIDEEKELVNEDANADSKNSDAKDSSNIPQRVSTRKKIKKSLGPDFVDSSDQLMYYIKEPSTTAKCCICSGLFAKLKPPTILGRKTKLPDNNNGPEANMIQCGKCDLKAHIQCLSLKETVGLRFQWKCAACGTCSHCNVKQNKRKEFIISCKTCKRGYHTGCATVQRNTADNNWECQHCSAPRVDNLAKSGASTKPMTSLLNKSPKQVIPTVSTSATSLEAAKFRTLLPKATATTSAAKMNSQPVYVKPNTSLLSKSSEVPASNSLLMPVSPGQQSSASKVSRTTSNLVLNNSTTDKPKLYETKAKIPVIREFAYRPESGNRSLDFEKNHTETSSASNGNAVSAPTKSTTTKQNRKTATAVKPDLQNENNNDLPTANESTEHVILKRRRRPSPNFRALFDSTSPLEVKQNFIAWINCELKHLVKCNPVPLYSLSSSVHRWKPKDVHVFLTTIGFSRTADILLENQVDGFALLLLRRQDLIQRLSLKVGPALKLYAFLTHLRSSSLDITS